MEKFIPYFLSVNLLLVVQVVYYRLFLARQPRFLWNRIYLLGGMAAALLLPLIHLEIVPPSLPSPNFIQTLPEIVIGGAASAVQPVSPAPAAQSLSPETTALPWGTIAMGIGAAIYSLGVVISLALLLRRNLFIISLIRKGQKTRHEDYTLVTTTEDIGPASYFRYIFWNDGHGLDAQSRAVALAHERCHGRQLHSLDLLGMEVLKAVCWINPIIYLLKKDLRQTHEYLADQAALQIAGPEGIKRLLLMRQLGSCHLAIANYFHSHIKARIVMLTKNTKRQARLHYLLIAPLAGFMVACTSLGHPLDVQPNPVVVDSPVTEPTTQHPGFLDVEDIFIEAALPKALATPPAEGMVCLGHMPPVLNLDTLSTASYAAEVVPQLLNMDRIVKMIGYPKEAKDQKIVGKVVAKVLIDETGHVIRYQFLEENHALLRDAVAAHIEDLLFKPGMKDGQAAKWWVIVPFRFGMDGC